MFVLRCRLESRPQALHRFCIVNAYEQAKIAQSPLKIARSLEADHSKSSFPAGYIYTEAMANVQFVYEFFE